MSSYQEKIIKPKLGVLEFPRRVCKVVYRENSLAIPHAKRHWSLCDWWHDRRDLFSLLFYPDVLCFYSGKIRKNLGKKPRLIINQAGHWKFKLRQIIFLSVLPGLQQQEPQQGFSGW